MPTITKSQLIASICKDSFEDFVKTFWSVLIPDELIWNWHMSVICEEMQILAENLFGGRPKLYDLIVNVSPGSSKSTIASVMFPAWCWTRMAHCKVLGVSYAHPLALDLSRKCRDVVKSELYRECFPDIALREDQDTKGYFANTKNGMRYAAGSGGTVMGMHGHFIVIDDPLDPNRAVSESELFTINNWLKETLSGRKTDRRLTPMILIMQRLHQDDPTAQFLQKPKHRHICIPAEITPDINPPELKENYINGLMDPNRLPRDVLEETEKEVGPYAYAGQYRQSPVPQSGGMFDVKKLLYGMPEDRLVETIRYWDKAGTASKQKRGRNAYTVGVKMAKDVHNRIYILDVKRVRVDSRTRENLIKKTAVQDGLKVVVATEQEPGSGGKESAEGTVRNLLGFKVRIDKPTGDKESRADPFSVQVNGGNVVLVPGDWNEEFVEEMRYFPFSTTKDQVDAASGAFAMLARRKRVGAVQSRHDRD